jgi:hypothetical protein
MARQELARFLRDRREDVPPADSSRPRAHTQRRQSRTPGALLLNPPLLQVDVGNGAIHRTRPAPTQPVR